MIEQIGPYEVIKELGRGGMGVVYLAMDTRLNRNVAIKALPPELASDLARLERFEREAKTLAQLNHPNLTGIHGLEVLNDSRYLVLEYVEGESLADRLDRGPLEIDEAIDLAVQIAAGLEAAHDAGVIHRDLKPANIMVTSDGQAKVLDFGLARQDEGGESSSGSLDAPTMTSPVTQHSPTIAGAILGTAAYMSPEQARGRRIDKRTDIWSFGVVVYEMLVGASPFSGESASDSIGAVLHKPYNFDLLPNGTPNRVRRVLSRCLERDKKLRYRDIGDVRIDLVHSDQSLAQEEKPILRSRGPSAVMVTMLIVSFACLAAVAAWFGSRAVLPVKEPVVRKLEVYNAESEDDFNRDSPQISPDGMKIAFIQGDAIMIRDLSSFGINTLIETDSPRRIAWSPDGQSLAYSTADEIYRVSVSGGGATRIGDFRVNFQFTWNDNDQILFPDGDLLEKPEIAQMAARGGAKVSLFGAEPEDVIDFHAVSSIPGSDVVLYIRHKVNQRTPIEAWDGERTVVIADYEDLYTSVPVWSPTGHVLFARGFGEFNLWAVPFSPDRMEVTGDPFLVQTNASSPSVSSNGTLSFVRGSIGGDGELVWIHPDGSIESIGDGGEFVNWPLVSHDGTHVAFGAGSKPTEQDVWVRDLERGINTRISSLDGFVFPVSWSPDGREIAIMHFDPSKSTDEGQKTHFLATDGSGETREPYPGLLVEFNKDWSYAVSATDPRRGLVTISAVDMREMSTIGEVIASRGTFLAVSISPDGEHMLYISSDSGDVQVYCTEFPSGKGRWQVSSGGGNQPSWSSDGSKIYYKSLEQELMRVEVTRDPSLRFGIPIKVFEKMPEIAEFAEIVPTPDGKRFISIGSHEGVDESTGYQILLIENWFEEFREN